MFLGLDIDTLRREVRVPAVKVQKSVRQIHEALCKTKMSLVEVQSLVGPLNFLCKAIAPGRAFLGRLIGLTRGLTRPHHKVRISKGARLDLLMWLEYLSHFNGVAAFKGQEWDSNDSLELFTDATAGIGFGGYFRGKWVQGRWPLDIVSNPPSIAFLEFYPLMVAVKSWGHLPKNHKVRFFTDNAAHS